MINKREFLLGAACTVAAAQVPAGVTGSAPPRDGRPALAGAPGLSAWQGYLGQTFALSDGRQRWPLTLCAVDGVAQPGATLHTEQFVLGFISPGTATIPAGLHSLQHANGQGLLIQLSQAGVRNARQSLRAEFNLLLPSA